MIGKFYLCLFFLISTLVYPRAPSASAADNWSRYQLPSYDYTLALPATWSVFPTQSGDSTFSFARTPENDAFFFFARYHVPFANRDPYVDAVPGTPHTTPFQLANGYRAMLVTGDKGCRGVVWIYHRIERYVTWCGTDANEAQLFEQIARQMDAPSRKTGQEIRPPANPSVSDSMAHMLKQIGQRPQTAPPTAGWTVIPNLLRFPVQWVVGAEREGSICSLHNCMLHAATPNGTTTQFVDNQTEHAVWVGYRIERLDYDSDPAGFYLFDPTYYGSRIQLANGKPALLFAHDEGSYDRYIILQIEQDYFTELEVYVGHGSSVAAYKADIITIIQTFSAPS